MLNAILLQCVSVIVLGLVVGLTVDWHSAASVAMGGAAATIPNGLFALRLTLHRGRPPESYPVVFFLGELVKIALTIGLLGLAMRYAEGVRMMWLLIGLIVALQMPLFSAFLPGMRGAQVRQT